MLSEDEIELYHKMLAYPTNENKEDNILKEDDKTNNLNSLEQDLPPLLENQPYLKYLDKEEDMTHGKQISDSKYDAEFRINPVTIKSEPVTSQHISEKSKPYSNYLLIFDILTTDLSSTPKQSLTYQNLPDIRPADMTFQLNHLLNNPLLSNKVINQANLSVNSQPITSQLLRKQVEKVIFWFDLIKMMCYFYIS